MLMTKIQDTMKRKPVIVITAAGLIVAATATGLQLKSAPAEASDEVAAAAPSGPPPANVSIASVEMTKLAPKAATPGVVVSLRDSSVAAATAGVVAWVAPVGAAIAKGEPVVRLDDADARLAVRDAEIAIDRLSANATYQESLYQRHMDLGDDAGVSKVELDQMRAGRDEARAALALGRLALERAQLDLARTVVAAPFDGRVAGQIAQVGEFANIGNELLRLVDTSQLEVSARAPESLARILSVGDRVEAAYGDATAKASLRAIVPVGDTRSRMVEMRFELDDADWYIGAPVTLSLPAADARRVLAAPRDALVLRGDDVSVYVITEENTAKRLDVRPGVADGSMIEIDGPVNDGDRLVVRGAERLRDGQSVTILDETEEPSA